MSQFLQDSTVSTGELIPRFNSGPKFKVHIGVMASGASNCQPSFRKQHWQTRHTTCLHTQRKKCSSQTQTGKTTNVEMKEKINPGRISYLDSGNYSTSRTVRQLSHLLQRLHLLPLCSSICSHSNYKPIDEKTQNKQRRLAVWLLERVDVGTRVWVGRRGRAMDNRGETARVYSGSESLRWCYAGWAVMTSPFVSMEVPISPSLCVCAAHALHCFTASRFGKKKKWKRENRHPMGCFRF